MATNLLYGLVGPRRSVSDPDPWPTELELHHIWSDLDALERDALRDIARAERLGFDPTIRDHSERSGEALAFAANTFNRLGRMLRKVDGNGGWAY